MLEKHPMCVKGLQKPVLDSRNETTTPISAKSVKPNNHSVKQCLWMDEALLDSYLHQE